MIQRAQRGNILFLILLAVVLFAALSYAVTSSLRGGGNDATSEKVKLMASEVVNYFDSVRVAIGRMRLSNSCTDEQISFDWNNSATQCLTSETPATTYENPNSPTNCKCHVFHPLGGGLSPKPAQEFKFYSLVESGDLYYVARSSMNNIGTSNSELYVSLYMVPKPGYGAFCQALNDAFGAPAFPTETPANSVYAFVPFVGTYYSDHDIGSGFANLPSACHKYANDTDYLGFITLLER